MSDISTHLAVSFRSRRSDVIDNDIISAILRIEVRSFEREERVKVGKKYYTPFKTL